MSDVLITLNNLKRFIQNSDFRYALKSNAENIDSKTDNALSEIEILKSLLNDIEEILINHKENNDIHITSEERTIWNEKQNALSEIQLNAVNSGINSNKVSNYDNYENTKANKASTLFGYNINDAYTKTEIDNLLIQNGTDSKIYTNSKISELINSAPETLNTLNELSKALNDDPDFATTITNQIGLKSNNTEVVHLNGDEIINGDKTFTDNVEFNINKKEISSIIV